MADAGGLYHVSNARMALERRSRGATPRIPESLARPILVQKFGGTSLSTPARIKRAAKRVAASQRAGYDVVVVVSAMGDSTDHLLGLGSQVAKDPTARELDLLLSTGEGVSAPLMSMALNELGVPAVSLLGFQAGIQTDQRHAKARIVGLTPGRIERELAAGRVVVVAGFQGMGDEMEVTTLGRGGSDTTAVALAAALKAQACEIFTDVRGIDTADPRFVPNARLLPHIAYPEMLELASSGARVMHPRAVEIAEAYSMELHVRSSFHAGPGTIISSEATIMEERNRVRGIAHEEHVPRLSVVGVPDRPGIAAAIFAPLAEADIAADVIVQTASHEGVTDMSFTVSSADRRPPRAGPDRPRQGLGDRQRHPWTTGRGGDHVPDTVRAWDQHRDDLDLRSAHHLHRRRGAGQGCGRGSARGVQTVAVAK